MDIEALRSFIAFVDTGSFTDAAKRTFRTQGAISMQMKKLESDVGKTLFTRKGRNLELTDHGRKLVSYARRILSMHDAALTDLKQRDQHPPLVIGCPDDYVETVLPKLVEQILNTYPSQEIVIKCDCSTQLRRLLGEGEIDAAILTRSPEKDEGYLLLHDHGLWVHGGFPELLKQPTLPLVLYEADCKFHSTAIDGLEKQGRQFHLICSSSSATAIKSLVQRGLGISALARSTITENFYVIEDGTLPPLPNVDIVLTLSPKPHPALDPATAMMISNQFQQRVNPMKDDRIALPH